MQNFLYEYDSGCQYEFVGVYMRGYTVHCLKVLNVDVRASCGEVFLLCSVG